MVKNTSDHYNMLGYILVGSLLLPSSGGFGVIGITLGSGPASAASSYASGGSALIGTMEADVTLGSKPASADSSFVSGGSALIGTMDAGAIVGSAVIGDVKTTVAPAPVVSSSSKRKFVRNKNGGLSAEDGRRLALVIGNGAYHTIKELQPLKNPVHDAVDMTAKLRKLGFKVTTLTDVALKPMDDGIYNFSQQLHRDDMALLYYSGHGMQIEGNNYLLPVDAEFEREDQVKRVAILATDVLAKLAVAKTKLVFLDACRDNPFAQRGMRSGSMRGGLSKMPTPAGTLLVYSTDPDNFAADGIGQRNSPFTKNLLAHIGKPGVDVQIMLRDVRAGVSEATGGKQTPWDSSSLGQGSFYLVAGPVEDPEVVKLRAKLAEAEKKRKEVEQQIKLIKGDFAVVVGDVKTTVVVDRSTRKPFEPEMVDIPAGCFMMGSPESEAGRRNDGGPQHRVCVKAFTAGKYEITVGQFAAFVTATSYKTEAETGGGCYSWTGTAWEQKPEFNWRNLGFAQTDNHPVACVSWHDSQKYIAWLNSATGKMYRLLSEAEWEYAARAGTTTARYWGNDPNQACRYANVADQASKRKYNWSPIHECDDGYVNTAPVGQFAANAFGLYDTLGNVWEWNQDKWHDSYAGAPTDGSAWQIGDSNSHMLRGGSWDNSPDYCRAALRHYDDLSYGNYGFRVALPARIL